MSGGFYCIDRIFFIFIMELKCHYGKVIQNRLLTNDKTRDIINIIMIIKHHNDKQILKVLLEELIMKKHTKFTISFLAALTLIMLSSLTVVAEDNAAPLDQNTGTRSSLTIQMLHSQYPDSSYFSTTGRACSCHSTGCIGNCTCKTFNGGTQCKGFARYCYYMYNDSQVDYQGASEYYTQLFALNTDTNMEKFLRKAGSQCYVQGKTSGGSEHAVFIVGYSLTNDTVTVYDANMDLKCGVSFKTLNYNEFRQHLSKVSWCYTSNEYTYGYDDFV